MQFNMNLESKYYEYEIKRNNFLKITNLDKII